MKIVLVHDDFTQLGGAELLFEEISRIYPDAPIYTSLVNHAKLLKSIDSKRVTTSFLQKIPFAHKLYKPLLPFYPLAFEAFNFNDFDLAISSTTRFSKSIITKPTIIHICYLNSIPRFLYEQEKKENYLPKIIMVLLKPYFWWLKRWDKAAAQRVDFFIANSKNVQKKIKKYYKRDSIVIYPKVDTQFFHPESKIKKDSYYLVVSRLVKWKQIELAIKAAMQLNQNLIIVGDGPDELRLKNIAGKKIQFLKNVSRKELRSLYQQANALIVTQDEDFGMATAEAQACSTPVIGFKNGGTGEIIIDKKTGVLFKNQNVTSLKDAIIISSRLKYDLLAIRKNAMRFSEAKFVSSFKQTVQKVCQNPRII